MAADIPQQRTTFDKSKPEVSVRALAPCLFKEWNAHDGKLRVTQLADGKTNSLFKVERLTTSEIVLVKVYGDGTEITIDREKELHFHTLLAEHNLAPLLLSRFNNGHAYQYVHGKVCSQEEMSVESIWLGVAAELAKWHTVIPVIAFPSVSSELKKSSSSILPRRILEITPNIWLTAQKWLNSIPNSSESSQLLKERLEKDFKYLVQRLTSKGTFDENAMVLGHGDLLHGNIINISPALPRNQTNEKYEMVKFIDFEHCTYCPAAFEIANYFSEWTGFSCDYTLIPSASTRLEFIRQYVQTRRQVLLKQKNGGSKSEEGPKDEEAEVSDLMEEVDLYRGFPGFYWGLCALIQAGATTGEIDFDYAGYAKLRLEEYWAWQREDDGSRLKLGLEIPLREFKWKAKH